MSSISYSSGALSVIKRFYRARAVIYVEGDDDIHFWTAVLKKAKIDSCKMIKAGGIEEINNKIDLIIMEGAKIIVACDLDHSPFIENSKKHPQIIRTYGYSIENTMYCPYVLNHIVKKIARSDNDMKNEILRWYDSFCKDSNKLLVYDIANKKYPKGKKIFGDNCCRYLARSNSPDLSQSKINSFMYTMKDLFNKDELAEVQRLIKEDKRARRYLIKGHFLTHGVINQIKRMAKDMKHVREPQISLDMLYTLSVDGCFSCEVDDCVDFNQLSHSLQTAVSLVA